ncbi:protein of unknown function [Modestobacter italicus]|uniref:Uncharacterized protein n=1 Tax=Modestobacter italicus (strain DSM 44449 / CECT 9708 / BC 501) TaxID=2732864 RepID=I4F0L1_MODI5|nr:protein of unknown function [Modestobacter marinus]
MLEACRHAPSTTHAHSVSGRLPAAAVLRACQFLRHPGQCPRPTSGRLATTGAMRLLLASHSPKALRSATPRDLLLSAAGPLTERQRRDCCPCQGLGARTLGLRVGQGRRARTVVGALLSVGTVKSMFLRQLVPDPGHEFRVMGGTDRKMNLRLETVICPQRRNYRQTADHPARLSVHGPAPLASTGRARDGCTLGPDGCRLELGASSSACNGERR